MKLYELQAENSAWVARNFGPHPAWHPLLGMQEELGELAHAYLKREQAIRGTREEHNAAIRDALADILIYMADFANREGIDLDTNLSNVWDKVKARNWKADAVKGGEK